MRLSNLDKIGLGSILAMLSLLGPGIVLLVAQIQDDLTPLGLDPRTWVWLSFAGVAVGMAGRYGSAIFDRVKTTGTIGFATVFGLAAAVAEILVSLVTELGDYGGPLDAAKGTLATTALLLGVVVKVGRFAQDAFDKRKPDAANLELVDAVASQPHAPEAIDTGRP